MCGIAGFVHPKKRLGADALAALAGRMASKLEHRESFQAVDGERRNVWVLSSYIAIRPRGEAGDIVGVAETYSDVSAFQAQRD